MKLTSLPAAGLFAATIAAAAATMARADEGMWTFDNFPAAAVKAKYGVTINRAWLDHVQANAVRLSTGCSASIVSGSGLVLTNHHCVRDCAQQLSTIQTDYVKSGFQAATRREERECPGMQAEVLETISDVTSQVVGAAAGKTGQDFVMARDAEIAGIEKQGCAGREGTHHCQVIDLYEGGQYKLYTYRKYTDVRLVFAPELQTAYFGGDPDNFNFPRYDLDCSFVRLYEQDRPVITPGHLHWNVASPTVGEPVFVAGNPGSTQRLLTADQLESMRDLTLPRTLGLYAELRGRLIRFSEESPEHARTADDDLFSVENSYKALHGEEQTLSDPPFIAAKARSDAELRKRAMANPSLASGIGDPWAEIARVQADSAALAPTYVFLEVRAGMRSALYRYARILVRAAAERAKPNAERLPEYADAQLPGLEKSTLDAQPIYPELEQLKLEFWLAKLRENLTVDAAATKTFLGKNSPETLSRRLSASRLGDAAVRKQLWDGGMAAVQASDDPMIRYVLATDAEARAARKAYEARVVGPTDRSAEQIAKARFAVFGTSLYPDATFSLRLSYGAIAGWSYQGQTIAPFTHFNGLYERATGQTPFNLAPRWIAAQTVLNPKTVFDLSNTTDIIGGNSGSPLINAKGEVIGAIFDGNILSLGGAFAYDPAVNRAVAVSTVSITEALGKVYKDQGLVSELTAQ